LQTSEEKREKEEIKKKRNNNSQNGKTKYLLKCTKVCVEGITKNTASEFSANIDMHCGTLTVQALIYALEFTIFFKFYKF